MYALCSSFGIFSLPGGEKFATAAAIFTTSIIMAIAQGIFSSQLAGEYIYLGMRLGLVVFLITLGIFGKIVLGNKNN